MIVGTAGHIDHGKTALVRALTGIETDRLKEEKARGITIELGYAYQPIDAAAPHGPRIGFVDMPGHERFIPTMLSGATGIGFALLAIAADDGVMPQTREHLQILQLLQMSQGAVALTKVDLVDAQRIAEVRREIAALLADTFLAPAPVIAVSTVSGEGIDALKTVLFDSARCWYRTRMPRHADGANNHNHDNSGNHSSDRHADDGHRNSLFRLAVDRAFSLDGRGTIVTGTVHAGHLKVGDSVRILPSTGGSSRMTARVRSMHALDCVVQRCEVGQRVSLNLVGIERSAIHRGDWVTAEMVTHRSDRIAIHLSLLGDATALKHWAPVHVHIGALSTTAHVALLEDDRLAPGASMLAELVLPGLQHFCHGDRIVVRDACARLTIGGGYVLDFFSPPRGKRSARRLALLDAQRSTTILEALRATIEIEAQGVDLAQFAANRNLPLPAVEMLLGQLHVASVSASGTLFACAPQHWRQMQQDVRDALARFHQREPDNAGVERERLRRVSVPTVAPALFSALILMMITTLQVVTVHHGFIALPQHQVVFSDEEQRLWDQAAVLLALTPFQPQRVRPMAVHMHLEEDEMRRLLGKSARLGHTMLVAHDHYFLDTAVRAMAEQVLVLCQLSNETTVAPFRDSIGTGRKLAVQILEFFNRIGYTRRIQDRHLMRQAAMWHQ